MPSSLFDADSRFPSLGPEKSVERRFQEVTDYLYLLLEELRYVLSHLGAENLNQPEIIQWLKDAGVADEAQLIQDITPAIVDTLPTAINQILPEALAQELPDIVNNGYITQQLNTGDDGDLADLTVDRLRTDYMRARKYLAGDQSDINYIMIHDEVIEFRTASVRSTTPVQLTWGTRSYYWTDGTHASMTCSRVTDYPVYVYQYNEYVKAKIEFQVNSAGTYLPVLSLGAGDNSGNDRARIWKDVGGLDVLYKDGSGNDIGMRCGLDGYTDLLGLRRATSINFTWWDEGYFTETLEGGVRKRYNVTFDGYGRPTSIVETSGHTCSIAWDPSPDPEDTTDVELALQKLSAPVSVPEIIVSNYVFREYDYQVWKQAADRVIRNRPDGINPDNITDAEYRTIWNLGNNYVKGQIDTSRICCIRWHLSSTGSEDLDVYHYIFGLETAIKTTNYGREFISHPTGGTFWTYTLSGKRMRFQWTNYTVPTGYTKITAHFWAREFDESPESSTTSRGFPIYSNDFYIQGWPTYYAITGRTPRIDNTDDIYLYNIGTESVTPEE